MNALTQYLLLILIFLLTSFMFGQTNSHLILEQKNILDNSSVEEESAFVLSDSSNQNFSLQNRSTILEIGTGTGYGPYPIFHADWSNHWKNNHTQTIYQAIDLGAAPILITDLQYQFERVAIAPKNTIVNVEIKIIETHEFQLTPGMFHDVEGATLVFSSNEFIPATSTGWGTIIDIDDYAYTGHNNLIIDISWGANEFTVDSDHYKTCKTQIGPVCMLLGFGDNENPLYPTPYESESHWYSNIRFYYDSLAVGDITGEVTANGGTVWDAVVSVDGMISTNTDVSGNYIISNLTPGEKQVICYKDGYNYIETNTVVVADNQVVLDLDISRPVMKTNPLFLQDTLLPEEVFTDFIDIQNSGIGDLSWEAEIIYPPRGSYKINDLEKRKKELKNIVPSTSIDNFSSAVTMIKSSNMDVNLPCPYGTIWSNPAIGTDGAHGSHATRPLVQQFNDVPSPFRTITVYGGVLFYQQYDSLEFVVDFFADGNVPGILVSSYVCKAVMVETGAIATVNNSNPVLTFAVNFCTLEIPTNNMTDGYVSVSSTEAEVYKWSWCDTEEGTGNAYRWNICEWNNIDKRAVCFGDGSGRWLTLDEYEGNVPSDGGIQTVSANLNAEHTQLGEVYTADIVFSPKQNLSQITVPVTMVIGLSTGIDDNQDATNINLFPNPGSDVLKITSESSITNITVSNYIGHVVYTNNFNNLTSLELNINTYKPGVYLVRIDTENGAVTKRFIVNR